MRVICSLCGDHIPDPDAPGVGRLVKCIEFPRRGGGANVMRLRQPLDEWFHQHCVDRESGKRGKKINARQESLSWDDEGPDQRSML